MNTHPTPDEARALLDQAARTASTTRAGASWPQIGGLLGLGGASSLALPALAFAPEHLLAIPMTLLFVWIGVIFAFTAAFSRSLKHGFGRRWITTIVIWGVLWILGVAGIYWWFEGQAWFLVVASGSLTAVTLAGAWIEARR